MPVPDLESYKVAAAEMSSATKFNNLVQAIEDELGDIDPDQIGGYPADAAKFLRGDGAWAAPAAAVGYSTTLPGSPTDGQEHILVDSTTAPTYAWRFRYNASSLSSFKWEFVGGSPASSAVDTSSDELTGAAVTTYQDFNGPTFTLPRAGDYDIEIEARVSGFGDDTTTTAYVSYAIGATAAADNDAAIWGVKEVQEVSPKTISARRRKTGLSASDVIEERVRIDRVPTSDITVSMRVLRVTPVRVS